LSNAFATYKKVLGKKIKKLVGFKRNIPKHAGKNTILGKAFDIFSYRT